MILIINRLSKLIFWVNYFDIISNFNYILIKLKRLWLKKDSIVNMRLLRLIFGVIVLIDKNPSCLSIRAKSAATFNQEIHLVVASLQIHIKTWECLLAVLEVHGNESNDPFSCRRIVSRHFQNICVALYFNDSKLNQ